jgi:GNAT superfamily N-acetyltransferase
VAKELGEVRVERLFGAAVRPYLDDLATLRITVFREYPYLYEGSREYEARYLESYMRSERATVVLACHGERVVGASTAMPLTEHGEGGIVPVLAQAGYDPAQIYYFGESVLLPEYRGLGIGHAFFDEREARARALGMRITSFCAVERPAHHPLEPQDYVPHDAFWTKRGYTKRPDLVARFSWRDLGDEEESEKPMVFWVHVL